MIATEEKNLQLIEYLETLGFSSFPIDGYKVTIRINEEFKVDSKSKIGA